jgi:hypothetical protein
VSDEILRLDRSYFRVMARANGTLQVTAIAATIDHGDESDITAFVESQMNDPAVAPILQGGEMRWEASGIVALLLTDPEDQRQPLMRDFLFLAMISGRFRPTEGCQKLIWADAATGAKPEFPPVPEQWWVELDAGTAPPAGEYMAWYRSWLASR